MKSLIIEGTEDSPSVIFDTNSYRFTLSGKSRPENTGKFYNPVIKWITEFDETVLSRKDKSAEDTTIVFVLKLDYFNSISAKYILDIVFIFKDFVAKGRKVQIEWHYAKFDDDMLETGKEISIMSNLKFDFIEY